MKPSAAVLIIGALLATSQQPVEAADVVIGLANLDVEAKTFEITASHTEEIAGFQVTFEVLDVDGATGGRAAEHEFNLPAGGRIVTGFHPTGGTIPVGDGVLVNVSYTGEIDESICILDSISTRFGGVGAVELSREIGPCLMDPEGCTDPDADNYSPHAVEDDGSCEYGGCMDSDAVNYDPHANVDDGTCVFGDVALALGNLDTDAKTFEVLMTHRVDVSGFSFTVSGSSSGTAEAVNDASGFLVAVAGDQVSASTEGDPIEAGASAIVRFSFTELPHQRICLSDPTATNPSTGALSVGIGHACLSFCGDGYDEEDEACDLGEANGGSPCGCSTSCSFPGSETSCGDTEGSECDAPDSCDGAGGCDLNQPGNETSCTPDDNECTEDFCQDGSCVHPNRSRGSSCGSSSSGACDAPDSCNNSGQCVENHATNITRCTSDANDCTLDICNDGLCTHVNLAPSAACGDRGNTACSAPDTCRAGVCQSNHHDNDIVCETDDNECTRDVCLAGLCVHPNEDSGTSCGDTTAGECSNPDTCNAGVCEGNHRDDGLACSDDDNECTRDVCDDGVCAHPPQRTGFQCGDRASGVCTNPDTCNDDGVCDPNHEPDGSQCENDLNECTSEVCDTGLCLHTLVADGTACGDRATDCSLADTCDGEGLCQANHLDDGASCADDVFCNGDELCQDGACLSPDDSVCGDDESCDEETAMCVPSDGPVALDEDEDGVPDDEDNCPSTDNPEQEDLDRDELGDACDPDIDGDGLPNDIEDGDDDGAVGPEETDPYNPDSDGDGLCDGSVEIAIADDDGSVICDQGEDTNLDGTLDEDETDPLSEDTDLDCVEDGVEVLDEESDPLDLDSPTEGGECAATDTLCGDGTLDLGEGCDDGNSEGGDGCSDQCLAEEGYFCDEDGCQLDPDGDGLVGSLDNCPDVANEDQADADGDELGDACDFDSDPVGPEGCNCSVQQRVPWSAWPIAIALLWVVGSATRRRRSV